MQLLCIRCTKGLPGLKNKGGLSATIITLVLLAIIIVPSGSFTNSLIGSIKELSTGIKEGTLVVPPPSDDVAEWPLIGKETHAAWQSFSDNMTAGFEKYGEQLKSLGEKFVSILSSFAAI